MSRNLKILVFCYLSSILRVFSFLNHSNLKHSFYLDIHLEIILHAHAPFHPSKYAYSPFCIGSSLSSLTKSIDTRNCSIPDIFPVLCTVTLKIQFLYLKKKKYLIHSRTMLDFVAPPDKYPVVILWSTYTYVSYPSSLLPGATKPLLWFLFPFLRSLKPIGFF